MAYLYFSMPCQVNLLFHRFGQSINTTSLKKIITWMGVAQITSYSRNQACKTAESTFLKLFVAKKWRFLITAFSTSDIYLESFIPFITTGRNV